MRLKFSNRYLSSTEDIVDFEDVVTDEAQRQIDPHGILATYASYGKHMRDNQVLYYERRTGITDSK